MGGLLHDKEVNALGRRLLHRAEAARKLARARGAHVRLRLGDLCHDPLDHVLLLETFGYQRSSTSRRRSIFVSQ